MNYNWEQFDDIIGHNTPEDGDGKAGGRGKCPYCKEYHNNVSFHREHDCSKNPDSTINRNLDHLINEGSNLVSQRKSEPSKTLQQVLGEQSKGLILYCDYCGITITKPAALLFSPPQDCRGSVTKFHVCQSCYEEIRP